MSFLLPKLAGVAFAAAGLGERLYTFAKTNHFKADLTKLKKDVDYPDRMLQVFLKENAALVRGLGLDNASMVVSTYETWSFAEQEDLERTFFTGERTDNIMHHCYVQPQSVVGYSKTEGHNMIIEIGTDSVEDLFTTLSFRDLLFGFGEYVPLKQLLPRSLYQGRIKKTYADVLGKPTPFGSHVEQMEAALGKLPKDKPLMGIGHSMGGGYLQVDMLLAAATEKFPSIHGCGLGSVAVMDKVGKEEMATATKDGYFDLVVKGDPVPRLPEILTEWHSKVFKTTPEISTLPLRGGIEVPGVLDPRDESGITPYVYHSYRTYGSLLRQLKEGGTGPFRRMPAIELEGSDDSAPEPSTSTVSQDTTAQKDSQSILNKPLGQLGTTSTQPTTTTTPMTTTPQKTPGVTGTGSTATAPKTGDKGGAPL